jgi:hypothetical protein
VFRIELRLQGIEEGKGASGLRLNPIRTCDVIRLFNSIIDVIAGLFHNFIHQSWYFCGLESITCRKCKNMLLILGNVAKMLPLSQSACSLTLFQDSPPSFKLLPGKITIDSA